MKKEKKHEYLFKVAYASMCKAAHNFWVYSSSSFQFEILYDIQLW